MMTTGSRKTRIASLRRQQRENQVLLKVITFGFANEVFDVDRSDDLIRLYQNGFFLFESIEVELRRLLRMAESDRKVIPFRAKETNPPGPPGNIEEVGK